MSNSNSNSKPTLRVVKAPVDVVYDQLVDIAPAAALFAIAIQRAHEKIDATVDIDDMRVCGVMIDQCVGALLRELGITSETLASMVAEPDENVRSPARLIASMLAQAKKSPTNGR